MAEVKTETAELRRTNLKDRRNKRAMEYLPFVGLVCVVLFFAVMTRGAFLAGSNLSNLVEQCFTVSVVAVGATFVYTAGCMDISVGAVMAVAELAVVYMMNSAVNFPAPVLILAAVAICVACMTVNGLIVAYLRVPALVGTLCTMNICTGILTTAVSKKDLYIPYFDYAYLNSALVKGIVLAAVVGIGLLLFHKTALGRELKAIGGSQVATRQSGIDYRKVIVLGYVCLGVYLGIAAFFSIVRVGVLAGSTGNGLGLNILVAIVLGGFPLSGGANSRVIGVVTGALTVTVLSNGLALMGVSANITLFIKGILFLGIVAVSYDRSRGKFVL